MQFHFIWSCSFSYCGFFTWFFTTKCVFIFLQYAINDHVWTFNTRFVTFFLHFAREIIFIEQHFANDKHSFLFFIPNYIPIAWILISEHNSLLDNRIQLLAKWTRYICFATKRTKMSMLFCCQISSGHPPRMGFVGSRFSICLIFGCFSPKFFQPYILPYPW